jgi:hypothetical protein
MYKCNTEACSINHCCLGKVLHILSVSVASVIQHAVHMCHFIFLSVASLTPSHSSTLSNKQHDFQKKLLSIQCVIFSTTFVCDIRRIKLDIITKVHRSSCTHYSFQILMEPEFSQQTFEKYSNINFHENLSSGSRVIPCGWADGWIDRQKS